MTDSVKPWIEERRVVIDGEVRWFTKLGDAHKALDALNAVLEVCDKALAVKVEGSSEGEVAMAAMAATVKRAIEGAIND